MQSSPKIVAWMLVLAILATVLSPLSAVAAPPAAAPIAYSGRVTQAFNNCSLTQVIGVVLDGSGNPQTGVTVRLWWGAQDAKTFRAVSGTYVRPETNAAGWDFTLNNQPVANTWYVGIEDGGGNLVSEPVEVRTSGSCNAGDANVVRVEFRNAPSGAAPAPAQPAPGTANPPAAGAPSGTEAAPPLTAGARCQFFTQTGGGRGGFSVCDDGNANFLTAFQRNGLQNVGYPISTRFKRDGFITQAFQKAVFQWRPDSRTVAFVNVFDELNTRGFDQTLNEKRQTPYQLPAGWDGNITFQQAVAKRQALLNVRPALRNAYFSVSNPLLFFGLPTSEVKDMGNHYAIRLQRAVLQEWKEDVPWARRGQVTVANGGDIAKELGHLPASNLVPEAGTPNTPPAAPAPAAPAPPSTAPVGGFRYGVQAHMIYIDKGPIMRSTQNLGFNWIKQQIEWKVWEPNPGAIEWGEMDAMVNDAKAHNITLLFSIVGAPGWAREAGYDSNVAGPPRDPQTFANFNAAVAKRYCNNGVGAIEVWNEQNLHYEWGNKAISPAEYMALLKPSYNAIKQACPSMVVIAGALTPTGAPAPLAMDDFAYLEGMYQNGLKQYSDAVGMHPSGFNVPPSMNHTQACAYLRQSNSSFMGPCNSQHHSWSFRSTVDGYRNIMVKYGDSGKKLWATEFGWAAGGAFHPDYGYANDNTFDEQASWTVEAYQYMRNSGFVGGAFLWNLNFRVIADGTEKAQWGIVNNAWQPLPVYEALRTMRK